MSTVVLADAKTRNLHATKACPGRGNGRPGWLLRVHVPTLGLIVVDSQILYDQRLTEGSLLTRRRACLDSNVVLDAGDGNMQLAVWTLDFQTLLGLVYLLGRDLYVWLG